MNRATLEEKKELIDKYLEEIRHRSMRNIKYSEMVIVSMQSVIYSETIMDLTADMHNVMEDVLNEIKRGDYIHKDQLKAAHEKICVCDGQKECCFCQMWDEIR